MKKTLFIIILISAVFEINAQQDICQKNTNKLFALKESIDLVQINSVINDVFNDNVKIALESENYTKQIFVNTCIVKQLGGLSSYSIENLYNNKIKVKAQYANGLEKIYILYFQNGKISRLTLEYIDNSESKINTLREEKQENQTTIKSLEEKISKNEENSEANIIKQGKLFIKNINIAVSENIIKIISNTQSGQLRNNTIKNDAEERLKEILNGYKNYKKRLGRIDNKIQEQNSSYTDSLAEIIRTIELNETCITLWEKETEGNRKGLWKSYLATFDNIIEFIIRNSKYELGYTMYALIDSSALNLDLTFTNAEKNKLRKHNYFFTNIILAPSDYSENFEKQTIPIGFFKNRYISDKIPLSTSTSYERKKMTLEQVLPLIKDIDFKISCNIKIGDSIINQEDTLSSEQIEKLEQGKYSIYQIHIIKNEKTNHINTFYYNN